MCGGARCDTHTHTHTHTERKKERKKKWTREHTDTALKVAERASLRHTFDYFCDSGVVSVEGVYATIKLEINTCGSALKDLLGAIINETMSRLELEERARATLSSPPATL